MEARLVHAVVLVVVAIVSLGASHRTANFTIQAPTEEVAKKIGRAAEQYRTTLAKEWLGKVLPTWSKPCPVMVRVSPQLGAGGATSFLFDRGEVYGWQMTIQGSLERILDSVLPHEVTHTIFASHFRQALPRWADEGACTTVEHAHEQVKQKKMLIKFLKTQRGISFSQMFSMKEYPRDVLPLYSQGYSLSRFLIGQGGKRKFLIFVGDGMQDENWPRAVKKHYGHENLLALQTSWLTWVRQGSPSLASITSGSTDPTLLVQAKRPKRPAPNLLYRIKKIPLTPSAKEKTPAPVTTTQQPIRRQAVRQQPVEGARQMILKWNRKPEEKSLSAASRQDVPIRGALTPPKTSSR